MKLPKNISYGGKESYRFSYQFIGVSRLVDSERCLWLLERREVLPLSPK